MPGQSIPGGITSAFGKLLDEDYYKPDIRYSTVDPERQKRLGGIWSEYDVAASPAGKADYLAEYAAATPKARQVAGGNLDWLSKYATGAYDPTKPYADILKLNKDALGTFLLNPALSRLTKERKARQAAAGYGGASGTGTYDTLLDERALQQLASEAIPNLLGNTTAAYGTAGRLGQENFLNRMGIIGSGEQYRQLDIPALRYLEPTRLARSNVAANLGALGDISKQEDLNRAYYRQPGLAERIGEGFNDIQSATYSELSDIISLYNSLYSSYGGGGGSAYGGGGGGGDKKPAATSPYGSGYAPAGYGTPGLAYQNRWASE